MRSTAGTSLANKTNKVKRLLCVWAVAVLATTSYGQTNSVSPLSINGIGETGYGISPVYAGLAGTGIAYVDRFTINPFNPAALTNMHFSTLEMSGRQRILNHEIASDGISQSNFNTYFNYFGFGFKMNDWSAFAVSLSPYSARGYNISTADTSADFGAYEYRAVGSGGYDQLNVAVALSPISWWSFGANAKYLFGEQSSSTKTIIESTSFLSVSKTQKVGLSDVDFNAGTQFRFPLGDYLLNAGAVYSVGGEMNARKIETQYSFINSGISETAVDTLYYNLAADGRLILPSSFGIGIGFSKTIEDLPVHAWDFIADYNQIFWTEYASFTETGANPIHPIADNATRYSAALSGVPAYVVPGLRRSTNYFAISRYRLGFSQQIGQYYWSETPYTNTRVTAGVSFPIIYRSLAPGEQKASFLNISIAKGSLWDGNSNSLNESYWNFNLGITLNDKWFQKFKYR